MFLPILVYACLGYVALLFGCHMIDCWQLSVAKVAAASIEAIAPLVEPPVLLLPPAPALHPFELSLEKMPHVEAIAAVQPAAEVEPSIEVSPVAVEESIDYASLTSAELRKVCSDRGIRWRGVKAGKHLSKPEMLSALSAV